MSVQAAICRVMKVRKECNHRDLVVQVNNRQRRWLALALRVKRPTVVCGLLVVVGLLPRVIKQTDGCPERSRRTRGPVVCLSFLRSLASFFLLRRRCS